ncbi:unnamed protein product [Spirodela intermedia]|uniref:Uncharacterized protein n=1 Tax=Spirodela intermedia TaxID=51605 RepID=A0A7I8JUT2_SPIIN|nr:unnamed protein product [Spirodela intermedia]CAA6673854.1 unnamed protein product [Spirodela intermedia]
MAAPCPPFGHSGKYYTLLSNGTCVRDSSFFGGKAVLNQSVGYSVILGFGAFFAFFTSFLVWIEKRYVGARHTSEWFNTAGRNVKTGLIASVIVSQWTWAATILQSSNVAWQYGISGPFWYASGATIQVCTLSLSLSLHEPFLGRGGGGCVILLVPVEQVLLFGVMAIEIKRKAPGAHTVCEIVKARWGTAAHIVFLIFCFMTNIIVTAMLLLGGSAVVNALSGVNIYAASFLIPLGVVVYTLAGGLKATFLASYIHSVIVHIALVIFIFLVYTSNSDLGSPKVVYTRLLEASSRNRNCGPVSGNFQGTYATMLSSGGLVFGIINIVGNFGTVFVDNGTCWGTGLVRGALLPGDVVGAGAVALDLPLTKFEAAQGLVPPATAIALMGKGGSILLLTMLFMAVTSAGSAELIAVSSLCTYDIYRTYINPKADGKQILKVSRIIVFLFGSFMGLLAVLLNKAGVSLGWMYLAMGVFIGSAVMPIAFLLLWRKANATGAIAGTVFGCLLGVITWLSVTKVQYGRVNLDTTGRNAPMLAGNLVSILSGGLIHAVLSFARPQNYNWESSKQITTVEQDESDLPDEEFKEEKLVHAKRWIIKWGLLFTVIIVVLWPLLSLPARTSDKNPLSLSSFLSLTKGFFCLVCAGKYSLGYFTFWAIIAIVWGRSGRWETIENVFMGIFTNDALMAKIEEMNTRMHAILVSLPDAQQIYLLEKEKAKRDEALESKAAAAAAVTDFQLSSPAAGDHHTPHPPPSRFSPFLNEKRKTSEAGVFVCYPSDSSRDR